MTKLKKYLKPFTGLLIMCVILLFIQAMSDLNLPNFMSDIINVGIQQGGIEHAAPEAISADGYDFITTFMTEDQQKTVSEAYESITPEDATESQKKDYPLLNDHSVYLLTNTSKGSWSTLDTIFGEADWTFINFIQDKDSQEQLKTAAMGMTPSGLASQNQDTAKMDTMDFSAANMSGNLDEMDISQIYPLTPMLKTLPQDAFDAARTKALSTPESTRNQTGAMLTKMFYSELGMNTGHIQTMYILR
ncbi:MAG: hypothetical protein RSA63_06730, partial [Eubacterium sp.]